MVRRGRGGKKFTAKGRSRYVATEDEIIARNNELIRGSDAESEDAIEVNDSKVSDNNDEEDQTDGRRSLEVCF